MNPKELGIIRRTAYGIRSALNDLSRDDGDQLLSNAMQRLHEHQDGPLTSMDAGYLAVMLMAWQDRGSPDIWA